jgi:hypothetical protein
MAALQQAHPFLTIHFSDARKGQTEADAAGSGSLSGASNFGPCPGRRIAAVKKHHSNAFTR